MSNKLLTMTKTHSAPTSSLTPQRSQRSLFSQRKLASLDTTGQMGEFAEPHRNPLVSQPPLIQANLRINQPNDRYEQEADRVAEEVMRMPEPCLQLKPT